MKRMIVLLLFAVSCGGEGNAGGGPFDVALGEPSVVVSLESELIGHPTDMALDPSGRLWVADARSHRVLVVEPDGAVALMIEGEGEGPGEFRTPSVLEVRDTLVRVLDSGSMRAQDYRLDGNHIADHPFASSMLGAAALSGDRIALPTLGRDSALVEVRGLFDSTRVLLGPPVVPRPTLFDMTAMKAEVAAGGVPAQMRNSALPVAGSEGVTWVLVQTEGEVRKYTADGELLWSRVLDVPEVEQARREFFRKNAETTEPFAMHFLQTVAAAREVDGDLWLMMAGEAGAPTALYVLDGEMGEVRGRLTVGTPAPAAGFVVDAARDRVYLAIPDEASILGVPLPPEVNRPQGEARSAEEPRGL